MRTIIVSLVILVAAPVWSQSRKLSSLINKNAINISAPSIAGNGSRLIYLSDYTATGDLSMMMSEFSGGWQQPVELPSTFNKPKLNFAYGHYLNFDGSRLYFTSRRSGSRAYDIWYIEYNDDKWGRPVNMGMAINSPEHEGAPSFTPDEREIYFCRCSNMLNYNASGCNIYYSNYEGGEWTEPEMLPAHINEGNVMAPRIMPDGVTLIYASNKPGGKGKFDLYMSTKSDDGQWSAPRPLDYLNSPEDDLVVSSRFYGNLMLATQREGQYDQLFEVLIPAEFKSKKVINLDYELIRESSSRPAKFTLQDWDTGKVLKSTSIDSGKHTLLMKEGTKYHLYIEPVNVRQAPVSRIFDLTEIVRSNIQKDRFEVVTVKSGSKVDLEGLQMEKESPHFPEKSDKLLDYVMLMVKLLDKDIELQLVQTNYMEDTIFVHEDMTETRLDTTYTTVYDTLWLSVDITADTSMTDTLEMTITADADSSVAMRTDTLEITAEIRGDSVELILGMDSVGVYAEIYVDTMSSVPLFELVERREMKVTKYYHNDRFEKEAAELRNRLGMAGVPEEKIRIVSIKEDPEEGKPERFVRMVVK